MLSLSGLEAPTASDVAASLEGILPTPEAYLAAEGIPFNLPPGPDPGTAASREASASPEERTLARRVTTWPRDLLAVEPLYFDPSGKVRHEAEVAFVGVVGTDGRLHQARLLTPLDKVHEEAVLLALNLWRFEAALRGDEHVAARVELRTTFRIY